MNRKYRSYFCGCWYCGLAFINRWTGNIGHSSLHTSSVFTLYLLALSQSKLWFWLFIVCRNDMNMVWRCSKIIWTGDQEMLVTCPYYLNLLYANSYHSIISINSCSVDKSCSVHNCNHDLTEFLQVYTTDIVGRFKLNLLDNYSQSIEVSNNWYQDVTKWNGQVTSNCWSPVHIILFHLDTIFFSFLHTKNKE